MTWPQKHLMLQRYRDSLLSRLAEVYITVLVQDVEAELDELVHSQMPQDHPCYGHVASSLDMVKGNPFWTLPQKQAYLQRLVRDMRSAV